MTTNDSIPRKLLLTLSLGSLLASVCLPATAAEPRPLVGEALGRLAAAHGELRTTISSSTGLASFVRFAPERRPVVGLPDSAPAEERARAFLEEYGTAFGIRGRDELAPTRVSKVDRLGMEHVRFRQTHRGVPVTGGELVVHLQGGRVTAVNARTVPGLDHLSTVPRVAGPSAGEIARRFVERRLGATGAASSEPRLELFNRGHLEGRETSTRLAWFVEARAIDLRELLWIDAESGMVLLHFSQLTDVKNRMVHDARDPDDGNLADLPGDLVRSEGEGALGDADVDAAYDFSGDTYDYFMDYHGRDSFDDAGATLVSTVRYCPEPASGSCPYFNAFWNGTQMVYGEGLPAADDVDAHELTHAVNEHTANQFYYMQSGALNESFSDIFGETVDLLNGAGSDGPGDRWLMGEDIPGYGAIRDMMDPTAFGDPGKMSDPVPLFNCGSSPGDDRGGVHSNSGIPNHAYALMVDGGSYNGRTVTGLGLTKAGAIWYRVLAHYLTSASLFIDAYDSLLAACDDLVGTEGISGADCDQVKEALDAVEMADPWPCSPAVAAVPDLCPAGQAPSISHYLDAETDLGVAACPADSLVTDWCRNGVDGALGPHATSGVHSYWAYDPPGLHDLLLPIDPALTALPANSFLQFNHSYGFDNTGTTSLWDGGVLELSTNGGASWFDAGSQIVAGQAYTGPIDSCCSNPLAGRAAFGADSRGYTATQLDLSVQAGSALLYRFRLGADDWFHTDDFGWFVDDVRIYSCAACLATRILDGAYNGTAASYAASALLRAGSGFTVAGTETVTFAAPTVRLDNHFVAYGDLVIENGSCP